MHEEIPGARAEGAIAARRPRRLRRRRRRRRGAPRDRHGLPEAQPVPDDVDLRQRRRRAAADRPRGVGPRASASRRRCAAPACGTRSRTASASPGIGLSGGQQQRLCIARAIAVEPEVILMDEPCSALDPIATLKIEELIDELKQRYTIVIVTHNMQQAARVADTTAFMLDGELVELGPTEQDLHQPRRRAHRGVRDREVRLMAARAASTSSERAARARGRGARRPRPRRRAARPHARGARAPGRRAGRDRDRRRRPHRRPLPGGPPGDPVAARAAGAGGRRPARSSPRCCT